MRHVFFIVIAWAAIFQSCHNGRVQHPNVIVIMADDAGWGDFGRNGNTEIETPHIDQIAGNGASFTNFYVQPVCSPTRAEFLTGRYHLRSGIYATSAGGERIDLDENLLSERFLQAGYRTACFGKWHSGTQHPYHPNSRGFEEFYGFTSGHWGNYFDPILDHNNTFIKGKGFLPDDLTDRAISFVTKKSPFFIYLSYNTPHSPMQVPEKWWSKFERKVLKGVPRDPQSMNHARAAYAMVENLDWNIGRLLKHLEETGLDENTIVVFLTDNGPNGQRWNDGMRGRKGSTDEGGVRSPLFIRWTNTIQPGSEYHNLVGAIDLAPTLAELCNLGDQDSSSYDGISFASILRGKEGRKDERFLVHHWRNQTSIRSQKYRLDSKERLYNIESDRNQNQDVSNDEGVMRQALINFKKAWHKDVMKDFEGALNRPFTIGFAPGMADHLPARDAEIHGNIERSNRYPNDSYFTNWISESDKITWDIEVYEEGEYSVSISYTCAEDQLGSTIRLSANDSYELDWTVASAHNPPVRGQEHDRVKRAESYVKDFNKVHIGNLFLSKGRQQLRLRALSISKDSVIDINRLTLKKDEL